MEYCYWPLLTEDAGRGGGRPVLETQQCSRPPPVPGGSILAVQTGVIQVSRRDLNISPALMRSLNFVPFLSLFTFSTSSEKTEARQNIFLKRGTVGSLV